MLGAFVAATIATISIWLGDDEVEIADRETIKSQVSSSDKKPTSLASDTKPKIIEPIVHESPKDAVDVLPAPSSRLIEAEDLILHPDTELMTEQGIIDEQVSSIYEEYSAEEIYSAGFASMIEFENYWRNVLSIDNGVKFSIVKKNVNGEKVMTFVFDQAFPEVKK